MMIDSKQKQKQFLASPKWTIAILGLHFFMKSIHVIKMTICIHVFSDSLHLSVLRESAAWRIEGYNMPPYLLREGTHHTRWVFAHISQLMLHVPAPVIF